VEKVALDQEAETPLTSAFTFLTFRIDLFTNMRVISVSVEYFPFIYGGIGVTCEG
jgi:hypothetical protein